MSGAADGTIIIWNAHTLQWQQTLQASSRPIVGVASCHGATTSPGSESLGHRAPSYSASVYGKNESRPRTHDLSKSGTASGPASGQGDHEARFGRKNLLESSAASGPASGQGTNDLEGVAVQQDHDPSSESTLEDGGHQRGTFAWKEGPDQSSFSLLEEGGHLCGTDLAFKEYRDQSSFSTLEDSEHRKGSHDSKETSSLTDFLLADHFPLEDDRHHKGIQASQESSKNRPQSSVTERRNERARAVGGSDSENCKYTFCASDTEISRWNTQIFVCTHRAIVQKCKISVMHLYGGLLFCGSNGGDVGVFQAHALEHEILETIHCGASAVSAIVCLGGKSGSERLFVGCQDGSVCVFALNRESVCMSCSFCSLRGRGVCVCECDLRSDDTLCQDILLMDGLQCRSAGWETICKVENEVLDAALVGKDSSLSTQGHWKLLCRVRVHVNRVCSLATDFLGRVLSAGADGEVCVLLLKEDGDSENPRKDQYSLSSVESGQRGRSRTTGDSVQNNAEVLGGEDKDHRHGQKTERSGFRMHACRNSDVLFHLSLDESEQDGVRRVRSHHSRACDTAGVDGSFRAHVVRVQKIVSEKGYTRSIAVDRQHRMLCTNAVGDLSVWHLEGFGSKRAGRSGVVTGEEGLQE